jgi:hypothetical protein
MMAEGTEMVCRKSIGYISSSTRLISINWAEVEWRKKRWKRRDVYIGSLSPRPNQERRG